MSSAKNNEKTSEQLVLDARLFDAIIECNTGMAQELIKIGADLNSRDEDGVSPLYKAVLMKDNEMLKLLIKKGAPVKKGHDTSDALNHAVSLKNLTLVKILVQAGADLKDTRADMSPLRAAVTSFRNFNNNEDSYAIIRYLIEKGAPVNAADQAYPDGIEPLLCDAIPYRDHTLVKILLDSGASINARDDLNNTPLILAAEVLKDNDTRLLYTLIHRGADVKKVNSADETVLTNILQKKNSDHKLIKLLLRKKCSVREADLRYAALGGNPEIFNLLHATKPKVDYTNILYSAAAGGSTEIISIIFKMESHNPKLQKERSHAMKAAIDKGNLKAVKLFISTGTDINDERSDPAIITAAKSGHLDIVQHLVSAGASVNTLDGYSNSPLTEAADNGHEPVVRYLLEQGADVNHVCNSWNMTALLWACLRGNTGIVKVLLEKGANINAKNDKGKSPLGIALEHQRYETAAFLISREVDLENYSDDDLNKVLASMVNTGDLEIIRGLLENKEFKTDGRIGSAIIAAAEKGNTAILELLLTTSPAAGKRFGGTALTAACRHLNADTGMPVVRLLLKYHTPGRHSSALILAAVANNVDDSALMANELLKYDIDVDVHDNNGYTPLMYAAKRRDLQLVKAILDKGADVNYQYSRINWDNFFEILGTNILIGLQGGFKSPVKFFAAMKESYKNCRIIGDTALLIAAEGQYHGMGTEGPGNDAIVKMLLKEGARVSDRDMIQNTPLILAARGSCIESVQDLLAAGADVKAVNKNGITALMRAAMSGNGNIVTLLIEQGSPLDARADSEYNDATALLFAVKEDNINAAQILLEHGARDKEAEQWAKSNDVKALLLRYEKSEKPQKNSKIEKSLEEVISREREKKKLIDREKEIKKLKKYPPDTEILSFLDPFGEPLSGAVIAIEYDGKTERKTTDKEGQIYLKGVKDPKSIKIVNSPFGPLKMKNQE